MELAGLEARNKVGVTVTQIKPFTEDERQASIRRERANAYLTHSQAVDNRRAHWAAQTLAKEEKHHGKETNEDQEEKK